MRWHYNIKCWSLIPLKYDLFFIIILQCIDASVLFWHEFKKLHYSKKKAHAFPPIQKQPFPFPYYCGIGDLPGFALAIQISLLQDVILQHDDATPHTAHWTQELMQSYFGQLVDYPPYLIK